MKPRIFRASDMKTALEAVQRELGPDALVISARQISSPAWQIWQQPGQATEHVEILATLPGNASQPSAAKNTAHTAPRTGSPTPAAQPPASQQSRTPLPSSVSSPHAPSPVRPRPSALKLITQTLLNQGLDEKLAAKWMTACMQVYKSDSRESYQQLRTAVQFQMEAELKIISEKRITDGANQRYTGSDLYRPSQNVICLVGTSGVGKTSVAATLAARYARSGRKVAWICADTVRAGAIAQAQACADSLSIPLQFAYTPAELSALVSSGTDHRSGTDHHPSAILRQAQDASGCLRMTQDDSERRRETGWEVGSGEWEANNRMEVEQILIDLPSCNPRKERDVLACGDLLTALPWRTVYLVLSATTKEIEMQQTLAALGTFDLTGLIITKLDECETIGNVINAAWRSRLPLAYFTFGPRLVEDLQPAHISNLTEILFER